MCSLRFSDKTGPVYIQHMLAQFAYRCYGAGSLLKLTKETSYTDEAHKAESNTNDNQHTAVI